MSQVLECFKNSSCIHVDSLEQDLMKFWCKICNTIRYTNKFKL